MQHLVRRNGYLYFRIAVPTDLWPRLGMKEIKKSLKTCSLKSAKQLVKVYGFQAERLFTLARTNMLSDEQIQSLVDEYLHKNLREREGDRAEGFRVPKDVYELEGLLDDHKDMLAECREHLAHNWVTEKTGMVPVAATVDAILRERGMAVDRKSPEYRKLCREMLKTWIAIHEIERERIQGNYSNPYDLALRSLKQAVSMGTPENGEQEQPKAMKLSELIDKYVSLKKSKNEWEYKTELENVCIFNRFLWMFGDIEVGRLNDDIFDDHLKYLQQLPANYMKKDAYKGKPCKEVLAIAATRNDKTLGIKTVNKATFTMSTLMAWATKRGYVGRNHAEGRRVEDKRRASEKRKAYDTEDLKKLVSSPVYTTDIPVRKAEKFWLPLIGLFSGARLNEICSLYVEDIREIDGIPCFDLNQNREDKKVKTDTSERIIPIHPTLIEVGFLDYVKKAREQGQARLWPNLTWTKGNGYGGAFGQWYGRYIREHVTEDPQKVFHSFRHTLINGLKQKLVPVEVIEAIDGHVGSRAHDMTLRNYGKAYPPETLLEALMKLDYGVSLGGIAFPLDEVHMEKR